MKAFHNKTILITGGNTDMAQASAELFSLNGATVILTDVNDIETAHNQIQLDLTAQDAIPKLSAYLKEKELTISILINIAAIGGAPYEKTDTPFFQRVLDINTTAAFSLSHFVADKLIAGNLPGSIINITTIHASIPNTDPAYSASKAALLALTKSLALYLAPYHIRVNSVAPGAITGGMNSKLSQDQTDHMTKEIPMAHFGAPEDIAKALFFLASDDASYITGQDLKVDGGLSLADSSYNR